MSDFPILQKVIRADEQFFWNVTGSLSDVKYNPLYWLLTISTLGLFLLILYFKRIYTSYSLTNRRLLIISGILSKSIDEIELFRITDSIAEQSLFDIWADIGSVQISSSDKTGNIAMKKVPHPHYLRDTLRQQYTIARQAKGTVLLETLNRD